MKMRMVRKRGISRDRPASGGPAMMLALGIGAMLAGSLVAGQRRAHQRERIMAHPDDAPPAARRVSERIELGRSITINRPRADLYAFWRDIRNMPSFLESVEKVTPTEKGATWTFSLPGGATFDLETEITEERENESLLWRSVEGSPLALEGAVTFRDAPAGRGTIVEFTMASRSPAGPISRLLQRFPDIRARHELKRFKMLMETGEIATSRNRSIAS